MVKARNEVTEVYARMRKLETTKEEAAKAEDDAACRSTNAKPGEAAYEACRQERETKRATKAEIDYQKARDFDRVLGGLNEY